MTSIYESCRLVFDDFTNINKNKKTQGMKMKLDLFPKGQTSCVMCKHALNAVRILSQKQTKSTAMTISKTEEGKGFVQHGRICWIRRNV